MAQAEQLVAEEVKCKIKQFIIDNFLFGGNENLFSEDDSFLEKGIIDSTGILELIEFIEANYHIKAEDHELLPENFDSLNTVTSFILRKIGT